METANTYRAIITGTTILFSGCLIWLLVSRQTISSLDGELDRTKLRNESLLSEKLQTEKRLDRQLKQAEIMSKKVNRIEEALKNKSGIISSQANENSRVRKALQRAHEQQQQDQMRADELQARLAFQGGQYAALQNKAMLLNDSVRLLQNTLTSLELQLDDAVTRSIDHTLVIAEKRNNKPTLKARRVNELVANVQIPARLNDLSFIVEGPGGAVLSADNGTLTVRQIAARETVTASLNDTQILFLPEKRMEVVYKPDKKLYPGLYTFKIYNGSDYVGSMQVSLR